MATKSFDEKIVVRDQKTVIKMKNKLDSDSFGAHSHKCNSSCTAQSTINNSKKWII